MAQDRDQVLQYRIHSVRSVCKAFINIFHVLPFGHTAGRAGSTFRYHQKREESGPRRIASCATSPRGTCKLLGRCMNFGIQGNLSQRTHSISFTVNVSLGIDKIQLRHQNKTLQPLVHHANRWLCFALRTHSNENLRLRPMVDEGLVFKVFYLSLSLNLRSASPLGHKQAMHTA